VNSDTAEAIPRLVASGILPPEKAPLLRRVARRELVSVQGELRLLLYLGVLLVTGGVGLLVQENLDRIGPAVIAAGIGLAAAACFAWVIRVSPPFSWGEGRSPRLAFDYVLLLGVLLAAADLAYVEVQFTPLGRDWPWHLLIVALLAGLAAFRFDSRVVFSLALTSFAAWRGVSAGRFGEGLLEASGDLVRWNAIACGALFVALGFVLKRTGRKAHFEPVAVNLGWLLILGGLASGIGEGQWQLYTLSLLACGAALAAGAYRFRRFSLFAFGVVAGYAALSRLVIATGDVFAVFGCFWFFGTAILLLLGLIWAQRRMREPL
jgi:FtsH-binding integral membrane protein